MFFSCWRLVVCITAKIHFLKQFTTTSEGWINGVKLFVLLQRYTFWSNSQLYSNWLELKKVVCITAKIHFLKQFTTYHQVMLQLLTLFVLLQRYTFWSNSQQSTEVLRINVVVCITAKIHFLKQFTTQPLIPSSGP